MHLFMQYAITRNISHSKRNCCITTYTNELVFRKLSAFRFILRLDRI